MVKSKLDKLRNNMNKLATTAGSSTSGLEMKKIQSVIGYDSIYKEMDVPLNRVYRDPDQPRPDSEVFDGLETFADKLEADKFVLAQLPLYYGFPDETFQIIVGERRTEAFRLKGREFIKARVLVVPSKEVDKRKTLDLQYAENNERKNLSIWAEAAYFESYINSYYSGKVPDDEECFNRFRRSQRTVYNFLKLNRLTEQVKSFCCAANVESAQIAGIAQACFNRVGEREFSSLVNDYLAVNEDDRISIKVFFSPSSSNTVKPGDENSEKSLNLDSHVHGRMEGVQPSPAPEKVGGTKNKPTEKDAKSLKSEINIKNDLSTIWMPIAKSIKKNINGIDKDFTVLSQRTGDYDLSEILLKLKEMNTEILNLIDYVQETHEASK